MLALWNQFDDLLSDDLFRARRAAGAAPAYVPPVDIREQKDGYELVADLPGLTADDVEITYENDVLTLSGERKSETVSEKDGYRRVERTFGSFRRSFTLPKGVDAGNISAQVENGQLHVKVPKPVAALPRKVKILGGAPAAS